MNKRPNVSQLPNNTVTKRKNDCRIFTSFIYESTRILHDEHRIKHKNFFKIQTISADKNIPMPKTFAGS